MLFIESEPETKYIGAPTSSQPESVGVGLSVGAKAGIAGGVVGGLLLVGLFAILYWFRRRKRVSSSVINTGQVQYQQVEGGERNPENADPIDNEFGTFRYPNQEAAERERLYTGGYL